MDEGGGTGKGLFNYTIFLGVLLVGGGKSSTFAAKFDGNRGEPWATSMQGNPVRVRNCTCSCNPLKHGVCLLNVTGLE